MNTHGPSNAPDSADGHQEPTGLGDGPFRDDYDHCSGCGSR